MGMRLGYCAVTMSKLYGWIEGIVAVHKIGYQLELNIILASQECAPNIQLSTFVRILNLVDYNSFRHNGLLHAIRTGNAREIIWLLRGQTGGYANWRLWYGVAFDSNQPRCFASLLALARKHSSSGTIPNLSTFSFVSGAAKLGHTKCLRLMIPAKSVKPMTEARRDPNHILRTLIAVNSVRGVRSLLRVYDHQAFDLASEASYAARQGRPESLKILKHIFVVAARNSRKFDMLFVENDAGPDALALIRKWSPKLDMFAHMRRQLFLKS